MKRNNLDFFDFVQSQDFVDITNFWEIPYKEILDEVSKVPDEYWRRPFNIDNDQVERMQLDNSTSVNNYPGLKGDVILATGWKSLCFLNETGDSKDQINRFPPFFNSNLEYKHTLKYFLNNRKWTNVSDFSPTLVNFFKEKIYPYMHVGQIFVTRIESGGIISEHSDIPSDVVNSENTGINMFDMLNTFNLCLNHVNHCYSVFNHKVMPSYEGCLMWTNVGKPHWVVNMNKSPQYKIIWQGIYKKSMRDLVLSKIKEKNI